MATVALSGIITPTNVVTATSTTTLSNKTLVAPALGTPASGVVTNLTGTASININGTVGATTPAAGAFTTLGTTGVISAVISGGTANAGNAFWFSDNSASAMMYARQNGAGDLFALSAGATEQFRVTAGGVAQVASGVKFPATQSASSDANTLDDYEEGTWTPNQGSNLTVVGTFSSSGTYTKIGRIVVVQGTVTGSTSIAVTQGGLVCSNLPFNVSGNAFGAMTNNAADIASISWGQSSNIYSGPAITATSNIRFTNTYFV